DEAVCVAGDAGGTVVEDAHVVGTRLVAGGREQLGGRGAVAAENVVGVRGGSVTRFSRVDHEHVATRAPERGGGRQAGGAAADDGDVDGGGAGVGCGHASIVRHTSLCGKRYCCSGKLTPWSTTSNARSRGSGRV